MPSVQEEPNAKFMYNLLTSVKHKKELQRTKEGWSWKVNSDHVYA